MPKPLLPPLIALTMMTACAAVPPPAIAPTGPRSDCIACAALPVPSSSVSDTPETRALLDVLFTVRACTCAPALAAEKGLPCAP